MWDPGGLLSYDTVPTKLFRQRYSAQQLRHFEKSQRQTAQQITKIRCSESASLSRAARGSTVSGTTKSRFESKLWWRSLGPPSPTEADIKCRNGGAAEHSRRLTLTAALQFDSRAAPPRPSRMEGATFGSSVNKISGERVLKVSLVRLLEKSFFGMVHRTVSEPSARVVPQPGHTRFAASDPRDIGQMQAGQVGQITGIVLATRAQVEG